jgi:hypothetical protein
MIRESARRAPVAPDALPVAGALLVAAVALPRLGPWLALPALWLVPGYVWAHRVVGARGLWAFGLGVTLSLATGVLLQLPVMWTLGRLTPATVWIAPSVFCLLALAYRAPPLLGRLAVKHTSPRWFRVGLVALALARFAIAHGHATHGSASDPQLAQYTHIDEAYLIGIASAVRAGLPVVNYEAADWPLLQPWGYWGLYGITGAATGWRMPLVFASCVSPLLLGLLSLLYVGVDGLSNRRHAAAWVLPLALGSSEVFWLWRWPTTHRVVRFVNQDVRSFGENLWDGHYNVPALLLALATLLLAARQLAAPRSGGAYVRGWPLVTLLLMALPWFHPVYFFVLGLALFFLACVLLGRRDRRARHLMLSLLLAPLPFALGFVWGVGRGHMVSALPFTLYDWSSNWASSFFHARATWLVFYSGLYLVPGIAGLALSRGALRGPVVALLAVCVGLSLFTINRAFNYHWTFDLATLGWLLGVAMVAGHMWSSMRRKWLGRAMVLAFLSLSWVGAGWGPTRLRQWARVDGAAKEPDVATWIRHHTPMASTFLVEADNAEATALVIGHAERRVTFGHSFHLQQVHRYQDIEAARERNQHMRLAPSHARGHADYALFTHDTLPEAWRATTPLYEDPRFLVFSLAAP